MFVVSPTTIIMHKTKMKFFMPETMFTFVMC